MSDHELFRTTFDLGQVALGIIVGLFGWLIKREIVRISSKIEAHDKMFFELHGHVQRLIGREEIRIRRFDNVNPDQL